MLKNTGDQMDAPELAKEAKQHRYGSWVYGHDAIVPEAFRRSHQRETERII
jgi:hypothetical protein